eukprot:2236222-Pyramimonas_sp.AAC.1
MLSFWSVTKHYMLHVPIPNYFSDNKWATQFLFCAQNDPSKPIHRQQFDQDMRGALEAAGFQQLGWTGSFPRHASSLQAMMVYSIDEKQIMHRGGWSKPSNEKSGVVMLRHYVTHVSGDTMAKLAGFRSRETFMLFEQMLDPFNLSEFKEMAEKFPFPGQQDLHELLVDVRLDCPHGVYTDLSCVPAYRVNTATYHHYIYVFLRASTLIHLFYNSALKGESQRAWSQTNEHFSRSGKRVPLASAHILAIHAIPQKKRRPLPRRCRLSLGREDLFDGGVRTVVPPSLVPPRVRGVRGCVWLGACAPASGEEGGDSRAYGRAAFCAWGVETRGGWRGVAWRYRVWD